ncbi:MAG: trypsin-like peptidase domain-containing protein [Candidatus Bathyarchaeota archaeon]|nr:trypsin-like peptidase domain-containing protein [Candidatus Bathyarchaeota archaeon]
MGDEWFYETKRSRRTGFNWIPLMIIALVVVNALVMSYFVGQANENVARLEVEIEAIEFQLSSATNEIARLRDSIAIQSKGDAYRNLELTLIYNNTRNSVVLIVVSGPGGDGQGSGFVYDMEGRIITNNHVVEDADEILVTFLDGTIVEATLVGTDPYSDLAVIEVDVPESLLSPVEFAPSSELLVGEQVIALGNPFGLENTMTAGIVSATGRQMNAPGRYAIIDVIQTDAAINPGNSGGPLLNSEGKVVGMNTAILSETRQFSGIGFAIPSDTILREAPIIIEEGRFDHAYLGITGIDLLPEIRELMKFDDSIKGALVTDVTEGGPADAAGLRGGDRQANLDGFVINIGGDVIIGVEGTTVRSFYDLVVILERGYRPGDVVTLTVIRDNAVIDIDLELGVRPDA